MAIIPFKTKSSEVIQKQKNKESLISEVVEQVIAEIKLFIPAPIKGEKGEKGERGERGDKGEKGDKGERGIPGVNGRDGNDGKDGKNGKDAIITEEQIDNVVKPYIQRLMQYTHKTKQIGGGGSSTIKSITVVNSTLLSVSNQIVLADAINGSITISLPRASSVARKEFHIKKIDVSPNPVTIEPYGSETIDGDINYTIGNPYTSRRLYSDGSNWYII